MDIKIDEILSYSVQRGEITMAEYLVFMKMIKNASGKDDCNAIGRCLGIIIKTTTSP